MTIIIYCIGHLKEEYWKSACQEYLKRLKPYAEIQIIEVDDIGYKEGAGEKLEAKVKEQEGAKILQKLKNSDYLCALDLNKKEEDSIAFSQHLETMLSRGGSRLSFVIGGSLGLSDELKKRANESLSFSKMTFPHQLSRVILLEQLYRAFRILHHEPYHK
ncbi:MAG: 23S rRNA (pseudouridine(1915)-N(3))-methyltransferase RlmH [Bacilli bacterium]|nr:23S rRNA (pseudouridine(1915)-N(3))-methyltransferase RlmH [Bacilli bacterium]